MRGREPRIVTIHLFFECPIEVCPFNVDLVYVQLLRWCNGQDCHDSLLLMAVRRDKGFELEVTDPQEQE